MSAGDLVVSKSEQEGEILVDNASARRWLLGRRGFKPTIFRDADVVQSLQAVHTPAQFAVLLRVQRAKLDQKSTADSDLAAYPCGVTAESLTLLEAGVFDLPLAAVLPVADFYQLAQQDFLLCVMRLFFPEELAMLVPSSTTVPKD